MSGTQRKKKGVTRVTALLALVAMGLALAPQAALGQVSFSDADFSGYATGTYLHADALTLGSSPTVKADLGWSGASVASKGLDTAVSDELGRVVQPSVPGKNSYGAGFGLDVSLLGSDILQQQAAAAAAPPSTELIKKTLVGPIDVPGVLSAGVVEGRAQATYDPNNCILGKDLSYGQGNVADASLLTGDVLGGVGDTLSALLGTDPSSQDPGAVRSSSRTRLVPQTDEGGNIVGPNLGLLSETRQTLAPVVLFQGVPGAELTIELLGEWVIQAVATGIPGQSYVSYQPGTANGETPVLKVTNTLPLPDAGSELVEGLTVTLDQLLGIVPLDDLLQGDLLGLGLVELVLDPDPTVTESADGTHAKGVVDVVRVRLLPEGEGLLGDLLGTTLGGLELADVRVGHMEVESRVPVGGITCAGADVKKAANPEIVNAGQSFVYSINTTNPFDCELTSNSLVDTMTVPDNIGFTIGSQDPPASSTTANSVTYNDIGPIAPKESKSVSFQVAVADNAANGNFVNRAEVVSNCALETAQGGTANVQLTAFDEIDKPRVQAQEAPPLPKTGGTTAFWATMAVILGGISVASAFGYRKLGGISQR
ncbi:MAG: hypothetical protein WD602_04775 [Actinomycetota bacterium]